MDSNKTLFYCEDESTAKVKIVALLKSKPDTKIYLVYRPEFELSTTPIANLVNEDSIAKAQELAKRLEAYKKKQQGNSSTIRDKELDNDKVVEFDNKIKPLKSLLLISLEESKFNWKTKIKCQIKIHHIESGVEVLNGEYDAEEINISNLLYKLHPKHLYKIQVIPMTNPEFAGELSFHKTTGGVLCK
ncbi:MAG: hypothetical protein HYZ42_05780 [Bacteroidetes bacterium]|nr:hypothetical protein [Bacteroidota bacterium]